MNFRVGCLLLLAISAAVVGPGPTGVAAADRGTPEPLSEQLDDVDADEVRLDVALRPDGAAEWTVEFWVRLDDNESVEAFESLEADVDEDPAAFSEEFANRIDDTVRAASDATGREMTAEEFHVTTHRQTIGPEYGVVRYTFRWHGFAAVEGDELRAGDAVEGIYLDDGTRLLIGWPEGYELRSVAPEPDDRRDRAVIWRGSDTDFVSGEPRVAVSAGGAGISTAVVGAAVAALSVGLGAVWWYRTRSPVPAPVDDDGSATADSSGSTESPAGDPDPRDDLLSNEEQVLRLLEEYDGRMKQQTVVEELGWTDAKTSKVVSGLREEGKLESFRLGRENVLSLPDDRDA